MLRLEPTSRRWFVFVVVAVVAMVAAAGAQEARACGPDFPHQLLKDRRATMTELVEGSFAWEAAHLVVPAHRFLVLEYGDETEARTRGGSIERTLYDEGAALWRSGAHDDAIVKWTALLALPREDRQNRSTWAAFMLGKATGEQRWFSQTRALARLGFDDALGLASASLGEEARLELADGDVTNAVRLYAEQAALGSSSGNASLLFVARRVLADEHELAKHVSDPVVQRLVASYLFTRRSELEDGKLERVLRALEKRNVTHAQAADRLAAVAYRAARFDLAARLVKLSDAPLSTWVKAKLALRDGRLDDARVLLAQASAAFPADAEWGDHQHGEYGDSESIAPRCRVDGERAVLALEAREYTTALTHLLAGGDRYWTDAAYVAERVLSVEELEQYVAVNAPNAVPVVNRWELPMTTRLRALLARRLMRSARFTEAARLFDDREHAIVAAQYGRAIVEGSDESVPRVRRARALYEAAHLARKHGIDIIALELDPDWAIYGGEADLGDWESSYAAPMATPRGDVMVPGVAFSTFDEQARVASTRAFPLVRWHYRSVASDLAAEAAALVPERSHAYAALLCIAASYVIDQQPQHASELWLRYVSKGAAVDFASTFGRACPAPDFDGIARRFDDEGRLRPSPPAVRAPAPLRKREAARDASVLVLIALGTHVIARLVSRRGRGSTGSSLP